MCGLAGYLNTFYRKDEHSRLLQKMNSTLEHRGPDASGQWTDENFGIGLCHRRLSIIDLTPTGAQPMTSHCGRYAVVANHEIYNYLDLKPELESLGHRFRGTSDTEVLVEAISAWGLKVALQKFNGMFALAVWDRQEKTLSLARDRFGKKPLYYGMNEGEVYFGSELCALREHPKFDHDTSNEAITHLLRYCFIPAPLTIYNGVFKLPPGTLLTISTPFNGVLPAPTAYWSFIEEVKFGIALRPITDKKSHIESIHNILIDATQKRMASEVSIGSFLSGGIDSCLITAIMQSQSSVPIKSFCVAFEENESLDESKDASEIAKYLGTDHKEVRLSTEELLCVVQNLPEYYDEPFADPSMIPTIALCREARKHLTVGLTGDGGDEMFRGYPMYFGTKFSWEHSRKTPAFCRKFLSNQLLAHSTDKLDKFNRFLPEKYRQTDLGNKMHKIASALGAKSLEEMQYQIVSRWKNPADAFLLATECNTIFENPSPLDGIDDPTERLIIMSTMMQLPDDMLTKVDRASMHFGLELRCPLLDYRLIQPTWALENNSHFSDLKGKLILREIAKKYIPEQLLNRPKTGFNGPLNLWLRNQLRDWAEDLLSAESLGKSGKFNTKAIRDCWHQHLSGQSQNQLQLWPILMVLQWERRMSAREINPNDSISRLTSSPIP